MAKMVIELLKCKVDPDLREQYLQLDAEVWTKALAECPGFLGKEVWLNPEEASEVVIVIRWATKEQWKSIPEELLNQLETQFSQQMGRTYQIIESAEFQVYTSVS